MFQGEELDTVVLSKMLGVVVTLLIFAAIVIVVRHLWRKYHLVQYKALWWWVGLLILWIAALNLSGLSFWESINPLNEFCGGEGSFNFNDDLCQRYMSVNIFFVPWLLLSMWKLGEWFGCFRG